MNDSKLVPDYQRFYDAQVHLKESSRETLLKTLRGFPEPDRLNASWLRSVIRKNAVSTVRFKRTIALQVLDFLEIEEHIREIRKVKLPKKTKAITVKDLYSKGDLEKIFAAAASLRERAFFQVLYESACRVEEMLNLTFDDIVFEEDNTATIMVSGKTGTRAIPLMFSVPALVDYMNHHPVGSGHVWVSSRVPHQRIHRSLVYNVINKILKNVGINNKRSLLHSFRHTRLTELVRLGVIGIPLHKFAGWEPGSQMEATYIHLSTEDVKNEIRSKVFGLEEERVREQMVNSRTCMRCGKDNEPVTKFCKFCNMPLDPGMIVEALTKQERKREETAELERDIEYLKLQLAAHQEMLTVAVESSKREIAELREFLQRLEKQEF